MSRMFWSAFKQKSFILEPGTLTKIIAMSSNCLGMAYYTLNGLLTNNYKDYTKLRGENGPIEPSDKLKGILDEIISKDVSYMISENTPIQLYMTPGLETTHLGTVGTIGGGIVGLPIFYDFSVKEDVTSKIMVKGMNIGDILEDEEEEKLCDSLILSEKAKKYGIAREILLINTFKVYIDALTPFIISYVWGILSKEMGNQLGILWNPLHLRLLYYTIITVSGLLFWRYVYKNILKFYESEMENKIAGLGPEYLQGGIEYCDKALQRKLYDAVVKNENPSLLKTIENYIFNVLLPDGMSLQRRMAYLKAQLEALTKDN